MYLSARLWKGKMLHGKYGPDGVIVNSKAIVKECDEWEAEAMEYISEKTTIPVPKIIKKHKCKGDLRVEMEYIKGEFLNILWGRNELSDKQKNDILDDVAGYIKQLRNLNPPGEEFVGSAYGNAIFDYTVDWSPFGPFKSHDSFHVFRRKNISIDKCSEEIINVHTKKKYRSFFTHGNLVPQNIIVDKNMNVVGIINWEYSGWFPEYWEYTKALYAPVAPDDWYDLLGKRIGEYKEEYKAEFTLRECLNPLCCPSDIKVRKIPKY